LSHEVEKYTSDMNDGQWERLRPVLPLKQSGPGRPLELDLRAVVAAICYVLRTGCQWQELPKSYPHYQSVYFDNVTLNR
jgi:transposase